MLLGREDIPSITMLSSRYRPECHLQAVTVTLVSARTFVSLGKLVLDIYMFTCLHTYTHIDRQSSCSCTLTFAVGVGDSPDHVTTPPAGQFS